MEDLEQPPDGWNYSGDYDPDNWSTGAGFTEVEQAEIDAEECRICRLPYSDHDGGEDHYFTGRR